MIYRLADIINRYWFVADMSVSHMVHQFALTLKLFLRLEKMLEVVI